MGYIAKAYVIPKDSHAKNEVIHKLNEMGYKRSFGGIWASNEVMVVNEGVYWGLPVVTSQLKEEFIDCNAYTPNRTEEEAAKLFLELAQMDGDDASTLWVKMEQPKEIKGTYWVETTYHKNWASSNELIEAVCEEWVTDLSPRQFAQAFKDGRIEL